MQTLHEPSPDPAAPAVIVLIDDDPDARNLVAAALREAGYRVSATGIPLEGIELVRQEEPDLVLCDIAMPGMDGYAVVRALQASASTRRFPIAFLTGRSEFTERVRAFRFGVVDFISKACKPETLAIRVDEILGSLRARSDTGVSGTACVAKDGHPAARAAILSVGPEHRLPEEQTAHVIPLPMPDFRDLTVRDVLIADDDAQFRASVAEVFAGRGFHVREAVDGEDALRQALHDPPALLVMDVPMRLLSGLEVCRRLRTQALGRNLPVVLLSGLDDFETRASALAAGADDFLSKQTPPRELLLRVRLLLKRHADAADGDAMMRGRIDMLGAATVLQFCQLSGLTGTLTTTEAGSTITIGFEQGLLTSADSPVAHGNDAVFEFLRKDRGTFTFAAVEPPQGTCVDAPIEGLLMEACRRLDMRNRERQQERAAMGSL